MRTRTYVATLGALIWALPSLADACKCGGGSSFAEHYYDATHVFLGRVVKVELVHVPPDPNGLNYPKNRAVGTFDRIETFKGDGNVVTVYSDGTSKSDCTVNLIVGEWYMIFAEADGTAYLHSCTPSRFIHNNTDDPWVQKLRALSGKLTSNIPLEEDRRSSQNASAPQLGRWAEMHSIFIAGSNRNDDGKFEKIALSSEASSL